MAYDINEIVNPKAIEGLTKIEAETAKVVANILKIHEASAKLDSTLAKIDGSKIKKLETATKAAATNNEKLGKSTVKLKNLQTDYMKTLQSLAKQKERATKLTRAEIAANESGVGSYKRMSLELSKNIQKYQRLSRSERENKAIGGQLITKINEQDAALKKLDATMGRSQRNVGNYTGALKGFGRQLMGALGLTAGIYLFIGAIKNTFNRIKEFDAEMQNMAGIAQTSRKALRGVSQVIRYVAKTSLNTSNQVAKLATTLFTLGRTKAEVILMLKPINDLSIGLKSAADETADFLGQTLNAFGKGAGSAQHFADVVANIRGKTALNFERIKDAFGFILPTAKALKMTIGGIGAVIGILQNNGVKAARAGRLLNTSFARLVNKGLTLKEALDEINNSTNRVRTASRLFGARSFSLGLILADNIEKTKKLANEFDNMSNGALKKLTSEQLKSMSGEIKIMNSVWENFILNMDSGNGIISRSVRGVVRGITNFINVLDNLNGGNKKYVSSSAEIFKVTEKNKNEVNKLVGQYNSLIKIAKPNRKEQEKIKTVISDITKLVPGAITAINKYGKAMGINSDYAQEYYKKQQKILNQLKALSLTEMIKDLAKSGKEISKIQGQLVVGKVGVAGTYEKLTEVEKIQAETSLKNLKQKERLTLQLLQQSGLKEGEIISSFSKQFSKSEIHLRNNLINIIREYLRVKYIEQIKANAKEKAEQIKADKEKAKAVIKAASAEKLKIEKEVAEKTRQLFETEYQKELDAVDKKAKTLRKEGIKEVDIAKWVAIQKGTIQKKYDDKILAEIKKTNDKRIAAEKALFATIKEEEDKRVPDNVIT